MTAQEKIVDDARLREHRFVFKDRHDAGRRLGEFVRTFAGITDLVVLAIPEGGVLAGTGLARARKAPFGLAIVRKIRVPGSTESGFGTVYLGRDCADQRKAA